MRVCVSVCLFLCVCLLVLTTFFVYGNTKVDALCVFLRFQSTKVTTLVNNIIIGKMRIEHSGPMKFESTMGPKAKIKFRETGFLDRVPHLLKGYIQDKDDQKVATLHGQWSQELIVETTRGGEECLWKHTK